MYLKSGTSPPDAVDHQGIRLMHLDDSSAHSTVIAVQLISSKDLPTKDTQLQALKLMQSCYVSLLARCTRSDPS